MSKNHQKISKSFKLKVLDRDNYTCQMCNSTRELTVHHIITLKEDITLKHSMDNCITLCRTCHDKVHAPERHDRAYIYNLRKIPSTPIRKQKEQRIQIRRSCFICGLTFDLKSVIYFDHAYHCKTCLSLVKRGLI